MPTISVIIPAYNVAPYIGETLRSVFAQTFADYEVIIVNDGSPDTDELERALAPFEQRVHYLKQENGGAGAARNAGLSAAHGEFVAFLDGDDLWLPEFLAEQIKFVREQMLDLACTDATLFDEAGDFKRTYMDALVAGTAPAGEVTFEGLIGDQQSLITSGVVAGRQAVIEAGSFDEGLRNSQDFDLWVRLALSGARLAYQRKALVRYRDHEGSLSGDDVNRVNRELLVYRKIRSQYDLTTGQRHDVDQAIRRVERESYLVLGKGHLGRREFSQALKYFRQARAIESNWKLSVSCALLRSAPTLLRALNSLLTEGRRKRQGGILRNTP